MLWKLRLRSASRPGDVLMVSPDRLAFHRGKRSNEVQRAEADMMLFEQSSSKTELYVLNSTNFPVFKVELDDSDRDSIVQALSAAGWPIRNRE
jgi:hypothetical protein